MCYRPLVLTMLLFNTVLSGCASTDSMESQLKATPSEGAGFVPVSRWPGARTSPSTGPGSNKG